MDPRLTNFQGATLPEKLTHDNIPQALAWLANAISEVKSIVSGLNEANNKRLAEQHHTSNETCKLLKISKPTLLAYERKGWIKGSRIGRRVLYKHEDVMAALKSIRRYKPAVIENLTTTSNAS